jgi:pseudouridine synthase
MPTVRLHKFMADRGDCSRRQAERWIEAGWVKVNGAKAVIGQSVDPEKDAVEYAPEVATAQSKRVYYKFHKPWGVHTVNALPGEKEVMDMMDVGEDCFPVGRLDKDSTGLVIVTNDGRLSRTAFSPDSGCEKEYEVETYLPITDAQLDRIEKGGILLERPTKPCQVERTSPTRFRIAISEGMNRQIRRVTEFVGAKVRTLHRVRVGAVKIGTLGLAKYVPLGRAEIESLLRPGA